MKISTKGRYALRLMADLAEHGKDGCIPLRAIAERQKISEKYLEQIITGLHRAGLVKSVRGAGGGYCLPRPAQDYTVGEILRVTEGSLAPVACVEADGCCDRMEDCVTIIVWERIYEAVNQVVDSITLADLLARQQKKAEESSAGEEA